MVKSLPKHRWPDVGRSPRWKDYAICRDGELLTSSQQQLFFNRLKELRPERVKKIYRGNDRVTLLSRYGLDLHCIPQAFNARLFLYGDKSHYFSQKLSQEVQESEIKFAIDDVSDAFFKVIADMIYHALAASYEPEVQRHVDRFKQEQPAIAAFFSNPEARGRLLAALYGLNDRNKARVRDYYLTLLHHLGTSTYHPVSFLLSTTKSFGIAQDFSERARQEGHELILFGWVPKRSAKILTTPRFAPRKRNLLLKLGLPAYDRSFFPYEKEITLKGGLFSDYIYGYLYSDNGRQVFEVNPYIFEIEDRNWVENGLPVDQTEFWSNFRETGFTSVFLMVPETGDYYGI